VLDGILKINGMAPFGAVLDRSKATAIRAYVVHRANEDNTASAGSKPRQPDVNRGAVIAAQGTAAGAPPCAQCHAFNGVSDASGASPRLASQPAFYLAEQLHAYSSGIRLNAIMSSIAKALSEDDISDVTAYYAGVKAPFLPLATTANATLLGQGEQLAKIGSEAKGVPPLQQLSWRGRRGAAAHHTLSRRAIRTLHRLRAEDVAARLPQDQSRCDGAFRQAARRSRHRDARRLLPAAAVNPKPAKPEPNRIR
jgi:cytochrome c553